MKTLKLIVVYALYYFGHGISKIMDTIPWLYPLYQTTMLKSLFLQELWDLDKPWKNVEDEDNKEDK